MALSHVTRWGKSPGRRRLRLVGLAAAAALLGGSLAAGLALSGGPAAGSAARSSSPSGPILLALGDSLAAGYQPTDGTTPPPEDPATGWPDGGYPGGYAADLARARHLHLVDLGCPGETTTSFVTKAAQPACTTLYRGEFSAANQQQAAIAELGRAKGDVALVTFDLGANDIDTCFTDGSVDETCVLHNAALVVDRLPAILKKLKSTLQHDDPSARLVAMDYYDPFLGLAADPGGTRGLELAALSVAASEAFDTSLRAVYRTEDVPVAKVAAAFQTGKALPLVTVDGAKLPNDAAVVCRLTYMCPPPAKHRAHQDVHPNASGYTTIATAFEKLLPASAPAS